MPKQRENLRQFQEEVMARASREEEKASVGSKTSSNSMGYDSVADLQEEIDELRAEIARLRAELKSARS